MKKDSFPVELHHSQTPLLKLCNNRGEWIQVGEGGGSGEGWAKCAADWPI